MLKYSRQYFKVMVVFHMVYLWNEVGDPQVFAFLTQGTRYLTAVQVLKKNRLENFRANVLKHYAWQENKLIVFYNNNYTPGLQWIV